MNNYPVFLDFEASSLSDDSYPIAVAWNRPSGEIRRFLINPLAVPEWQDWDDVSESTHGIDRQRLINNGWPPDYVIEEMEHDLKGLDVWADAPAFDNFWLARLFAVVDRQPSIVLGHIENLLIDLLRRDGELEWQAAARLEQLKEALDYHRYGRHDAGADVGYLIRLWEAANGLPLRPNHRIGPLPKVTETGSFTRKRAP